jgi:cation transport ATPase
VFIIRLNMTHTYQITGMTCSSCESKVKSKLLSLTEIITAEVSQANQNAVITMDEHIPLSKLQDALGGKDAKYQISTIEHSETIEQAKSWAKTYQPLLLLFGYITGIAVLLSFQADEFHWMTLMRVFMAGFFLCFSFFKLLNLPAFAESYSMYDVLAKKIRLWAFVYPFVEFALGLAYAVDFDPLLTNWITLIVMLVSIIGVLQSVLAKRKIQCACLGAVFNLPMSTVTIIEDLLMIAMSATMLILI